jgi:hypothetical protein
MGTRRWGTRELLILPLPLRRGRRGNRRVEERTAVFKMESWAQGECGEEGMRYVQSQRRQTHDE